MAKLNLPRVPPPLGGTRVNQEWALAIHNAIYALLKDLDDATSGGGSGSGALHGLTSIGDGIPLLGLLGGGVQQIRSIRAESGLVADLVNNTVVLSLPSGAPSSGVKNFKQLQDVQMPPVPLGYLKWDDTGSAITYVLQLEWATDIANIPIPVLALGGLTGPGLVGFAAADDVLSTITIGDNLELTPDGVLSAQTEILYIDGGSPSSVYGGIPDELDGGGP